MKYYTDNGIEYKPTLCVGNLIEFDFFGQLKRGYITTVGKYGYWIDNIDGGIGNGSIRCPFGKEKLVNDTEEGKIL